MFVSYSLVIFLFNTYITTVIRVESSTNKFSAITNNKSSTIATSATVCVYDRRCVNCIVTCCRQSSVVSDKDEFVSFFERSSSNT